MKFFHLSDLHIGKQLHHYNLREDQEHILAEVLSYAAPIHPDAIVIAGDIYDKSVPSGEAVSLFDEFLTALAKIEPVIPVLIISGNHDSAQRLDYDCLRLRRADGRRNNAVAGWAERATTGDAEGWEARDLVRRAMAELPGRQREVLYLKDIEGYPTREIAGMVACDEAQVRVILSRARNALRGILKKMMDDERAERTD